MPAIQKRLSARSRKINQNLTDIYSKIYTCQLTFWRIVRLFYYVSIFLAHNDIEHHRITRRRWVKNICNVVLDKLFTSKISYSSNFIIIIFFFG